jgi:5'-nucleotidase / UDP-sugar diphosphatase
MLRLSLFFCATLLWAQQDVVPISILHFNDFHSKMVPNDQGQGGAAYLASAIAQERKNCPRCLLLNAGDNAQGSPVSTIFRGIPVFEVLRPLKADAFVLGNHEFDYGANRINDFMAAAGVPVLAANLVTPEGNLFTNQASVILERDGLRIGVVGVLMDDLVPTLTVPANLAPNKILPAIATLRAEAAKLKDKTDILIALVHLWREGCDQIVKELPEYAVTISGHEHGGMQQLFRVEDRVGARVRANGAELGRLDLEYDKAARKIVKANWRRISVNKAAFSPDPEVAALVQKWEAKVNAVVDVPIGQSRAPKDRAQVRAWIEKVMLEKTGADFAFMNAGGVRDTLPGGKLLARSVWNIMPFDNLLVTGKVPGRLIPDFIRRDKAVEPDKLYTVATIDFVVETWRNGSDEALKQLGRAVGLDGPMLRDVLLDSVKRSPIVE